VLWPAVELPAVADQVVPAEDETFEGWLVVVVLLDDAEPAAVAEPDPSAILVPNAKKARAERTPAATLDRAAACGRRRRRSLGMVSITCLRSGGRADPAMVRGSHQGCVRGV